MLSWICLLVVLLSSLTIALTIMGSVMAGVSNGRLSAILHVVVGWNSPSSYPGFSNLGGSLAYTHPCLLSRVVKVLVTQSFHSLSSKAKLKEENREEENLEGHLGEFCARK